MGNKAIEYLPVITYHGLMKCRSTGYKNGYNIAVAEFARQMEWLAGSGYTTMLPQEMASQDGTAEPEKRIVITFDDGERSNYDSALPLLEKYRFKAVFFITTKNITENKNYMRWHEVRHLNELGHSVQSHSHSHTFFNMLSSQGIRNELKESRNLIWQSTGVRPASFSCPGGRFDQRVVKIARELGYKRMFTSQPRYYRFGADNQRFSVGRFMIIEKDSFETFKKIITGVAGAAARKRVEYEVKMYLRKFVGDMGYQTIFGLLRKRAG